MNNCSSIVNDAVLSLGVFSSGYFATGIVARGKYSRGIVVSGPNQDQLNIKLDRSGPRESLLSM